VIGGRISVTALDTAQRMLAVGRGREEAANYLDSQYKRVALARAMPLPRLQPAQLAGPFDALIEKYARLHGVEAAVVRAIMATESAFNSAAISSAGAVGLMQLMPMTARELGVNPFVPEQNVEGGVRYFAQLMKRFGGLEMALVAYNGGPGYALRFARGQAALYGETRDYVRKVLSRLAGSRARS
jgi:peptidoglycan DL-endopeptidase CwlO